MKSSLPVLFSFVSLSLSLAVSPQASAAVIGIDTFSYPDGSIADRTGGTGFASQRTVEAGALPQSPSDWDVAGTTPIAQVSGGLLVTHQRDRGQAGIRRSHGRIGRRNQ